MIIDVLLHKKNRITVTEFDSGSSVLNNTSYGIFPVGEAFRWEISNPESVNNLIIVEFTESINLRDIVFDITANNLPITTITYSVDNKIFREYEFFYYNVNLNSVIENSEKEILVLYEGNSVEKKFIDENNYVYIVYEKNTMIPIRVPVGYYNVLKNYLDDINGLDINGELILKKNYVFSYYSKNTQKVEYFRNVFFVKSIKISQDGYTAPFKMNTFSIYSEENLTINNTDMKYLSGVLFQPKYFQQYEFIPSMMNTYFDMLVEKG